MPGSSALRRISGAPRWSLAKSGYLRVSRLDQVRRITPALWTRWLTAKRPPPRRRLARRIRIRQIDLDRVQTRPSCGRAVLAQIERHDLLAASRKPWHGGADPGAAAVTIAVIGTWTNRLSRIVTAAAPGIGAAIAKALLDAGYEVVSLDLRKPGARMRRFCTRSRSI